MFGLARSRRRPLPPWAAWSLVGARLLGAALIAIAPYVTGACRCGGPRSQSSGRRCRRPRCRGDRLACRAWEEDDVVEGPSVAARWLAVAMLWLTALIGFALRFRRYGRDLDSWMCLAVTLALFADLHLTLTPVVSGEYLLQGDFLRLVAYGMLLIGVWRAIADAEFGRAVADERARVAREIHDGLAQYLFAISTQSARSSRTRRWRRCCHAQACIDAAQQEARFAVLALSSAGGSARFDSALRRYIDVLTADGELEVDLDVDRQVRLAPDEQIEVFRIVQEGLGNVRRHAGARHVEVSIQQRGGRRVVSVSDDGIGFDETTTSEGQGLDNIKLRAEAIEGQLSLRSSPGRGTAIEVMLRPT